MALTLSTEQESGDSLSHVDFIITDHRGRRIKEVQARTTLNANGTIDALLDELPGDVGWYAIWRRRFGWRGVNSRYVPYCVVPAVKRSLSGSMPYGLDVAFSSLSPFSAHQVVRLVRLAGVSWIRDRISLAKAFPAPTRRNFQPALNNAKLAKSAGLSVLQVFADNPSWILHENDSKVSSNLLQVYAMAADLGKSFGDAVDAWEIWNEHDISHFGGATPDRYVSFLKAFSLGLASTSDAMRVLGPFARDPAIAGYARVLFSSEINLYLDVYSFHTYAPIPDGSFSRAVSHHHNLGYSGGFTDKPVWLTETGRARPSADSLSAAVSQASYAVKAFVLARSGGVDRLFWFVMKPFSTAVGQFGLFRQDLTPLPYYQAIAVLTQNLGVAKYKGMVLHPNVEMHVFSDGDREVAVAWSDREEELVVDGHMHVWDMMGRPQAIEVRKGETFVPVGEHPVFLEGSKWDVIPPIERAPKTTDNERTRDRTIVLAAIVPSETRGDRLRDKVRHPDGLTSDWSPRSYAQSTQPVEVSIRIFNLGRTAKRCHLELRGSAALHVVPSSVDVVIPALQELSVAVEVRGLLPGSAMLEIDGTANGKKITATRLQFSIGE